MFSSYTAKARGPAKLTTLADGVMEGLSRIVDGYVCTWCALTDCEEVGVGGHCAVCSVQCAVCSVQCAVCSVQCAVCSWQRAEFDGVLLL